MPGLTNVAVVPMLDISASMESAMGIVKIDGKAFIRSARPNDQISVVAFTDSSTIVYSNNGQLVTVSQSLVETALAAQAIEQLNTGNLTNIGQAIEQGNQLIASAISGNVPAFVLLSDGMATTGPAPATILRSTPPLYIAALGPYAKQSYFQTMLNMNANSRYYNQPNAYQMMQMFNAIRAAPVDAGLTSNALAAYSGSDYQLQPNVIVGDSDEAQINAVWSDSRFYYTSGNPSGFAINVVLIDPSGNTSPLQPVITDGGYAIFNIANPQPGTWQALIQYAVPSPIWGTTAGFEFDTQVNLRVDAPRTLKAGEPLRATAQVLDEGKPVEGLTIQATVTRPSISIANALVKHAEALANVRPDSALLEGGASEDIAKLETYRRSQSENGDILRVVPSLVTLDPQPDATHTLTFTNTLEAGSYNVKLTVEGRNPVTKKRFSRTDMFSTLVG
jgi:hypothetical protein